MRKKARVSYYEPEEPSFDEYVFCTSCGEYVFEYCSIHGPLLVVPDDEVPSPTGFLSYVPRAALNIPRVFLHLAPSTIPDAGIGVFSTLTLPRGVRFGPYRGMKTDQANSAYCWQIYDRENKPSHVLDARDPARANWMRYVNCSRHYSEQNLVAFQYRGQLYYRTIRIIPRFTELLVFYGSEFADELNIDLRRYHSPIYTETFVKCADELSLDDASQLDGAPIVNINEIQNIQTEEFESYYLKEHIEGHSDLKQTPLSDFETAPSCSFKKHAENHTPANDRNINVDKPHTCTTCGNKYLTSSNLKRHMRTHSQERTHICTICKKGFLENCELKRHMKVHSLEKPHLCIICNRRFKESTHLKRHMNVHSLEKPHLCIVCKMRFKERNALKRHMKVHSLEKPHFCIVCKMRFKQSSYLKRHMKVHSLEKPHLCIVCKMRFKESNTLKRHMKVHSLEKPHLCIICNRRFKESTHLKRHMNVHSLEKPHLCIVCKMRFKERNTLKRHMKVHSLEKPHLCIICNMRFKESTHLKRHMKVHTNVTQSS